MSVRHINLPTRAPIPTVGAGTMDATLPSAMHFERRLGKYTLTATLGEGAMGVVYRALDPHIDRVVAVKTIRRALLESATGNQSAALRFRNEARAVGRLSHPGIVSIFEYVEENEQSYIVMEYVEGASLLRCTVPQQRLPLPDVLSVMSQLLHALNYAHAHGVWHRDIKPSNLIVTAGGQLKITDFGIARIDAAALTQDASVMGSCGYMAPECYQGVELDQRVDLFACGVLLYELLTGRRPYSGLPGAVMHQLLHGVPPPLLAAGCSAAEAAALAPFEAIVARALAGDRTQRYPGAQEMLDALCDVAAQPIAARVSVAAVQRLMAPAAQPTVVRMLPRKPQPIYIAPAAQPAAIAPPAEAPVPEPLPAAEPVLATPVQAAPPLPAPEPVPAPAPEATLAPEIAVPVAVAAFDPAVLAALQALLVPTLGPVARVLVRRMAACSQSVAALVARLAAEMSSADERRHFLAQAQQALGRAAGSGPGADARHAGTALALPVLGETPLSEEAVRRALALLTGQIGPIARVMVNRARAQATSREQFVAALADLAADCTDAQRLREDLDGAL